jgi:hypothetical protein
MRGLKDFKMVVERTKTGFSAYSPQYPVFTTGKDINELPDNSFQAANMYLGELGEDVKKTE